MLLQRDVDLPLPTLRPRLHHFQFLDRGFLLRQREEGKVARKLRYYLGITIPLYS